MLEFNLNDHKKALLVNDLTEHELVKLVTQISQNFTSNRKEIANYVSEEKFVSAYSYFYLPTNYPKLQFLFDRLPESIKNDLGSSTFIDWGTGPGTYLLSFLDLFPKSRVIGIDKSTLMLEQAQKNLDHYFKDHDFKFSKRLTEIERDDNLYINFGNSINEMSEDEVPNIVRSLEPKYISFIEPGTPLVFEKVMKLRSYLSNNGYECLYPCSSSSLTCPMLSKKNEGIEDWCHQVLRMKHDESVERFSQLVKLDRKIMPLTTHFYIKRSDSVQDNRPVIVRYLRESKYSFDYQVCEKENDNLVLKTIEVLKKSMSKQEAKLFKRQSVGVHLEYDVIKEVSKNHYKVSIKKGL